MTSDVLEEVFGHDEYRPGQGEAVEGFLAGRDVTVLMPTGGGKSLCYQLPAVADRESGTTIVVSPLIALMNDQVQALQARGVRAGALHSGRDELEQRATVAHLLTGKLDLIYISPERTVLSGFRRLLERVPIARLAIDEAHCISQWGHDFRPEYQRLGELRETLGVPTMALTATATGRVMEEIETSLGLHDPVRVRGSFARPNLSFQVRHIGRDAERVEAICQALENAGMRKTTGGGRAIIYCATRKKVEAVAKALKQRGFAARHYHAGRTDHAREVAQRAFEQGRARVLVATNAFGMGVDHPDVRLIVHYQTPGSVEAYYQEAGRAGRDGLPAECLLLFGVADLVTQRFLNQKNAGRGQSRREHLLGGVEAFARATVCRQQFFHSYFTGADDAAPCGVCDICCDPDAVAAHVEEAESPRRQAKPCEPLSSAERQSVVDAVAALKRPVGKSALARALRGSRAKALRRPGLLSLPQHGAIAGHTEACLVAAIEELIREGLLERRGVKYPTVWLKGRRVREPRATDAERPTRTRRSRKSALVRALESYRQRKARSLRWKRYMVFNNSVLRQIEQQQPDSLWALEQIHGFGPSKAERFGQDIIELVRRHGNPA